MSGAAASRPVQPLHIMSCDQCGISACREDDALEILPDTYLSTSGTLVLPNDLPGVNYSASVALQDCDLLLGPGVAFTTASADARIVAVPYTYPAQSHVYMVPQEENKVIIYALATGEVFAASNDFRRVEMQRVRGAARHLWTLAAHPAVEGGSTISTEDAAGNRVVWHVPGAGEAAVCAGHDCLYRIQLVPLRGMTSLLSAFVLMPQRP